MHSKYSTVTGVVVRVASAQEADRVVVLITESGEQMAVMAKGVRKPTSRKAHTIDLGNIIQAKLAAGRGNLSLISEAKLIASPEGYTRDYQGMLVVQAACELILNITTTGSEEKGYYANLINFLSVPTAYRYQLLLAGLVLRLLYIAGFVPRLDFDIVNDSPLQNDHIYLVRDSIGYSNTDHLGTVPADVRLWKAQRYILQHDFNQIQRLQLSDEEQRELLSLHLSWLQTATGVELKTTSLLFSN